MHRLFHVIPSAAVLASWLMNVAPGTAQAQSVAGEVIALRAWAYGTPPAADRRDLFLQYDVHEHERLETVEAGALHVRLLDNTVVRLGSATSMVLDEFVYRPNESSLSFLATVSRGVCRFITGRTVTKNFSVQTPTASIAARGTEFSVWVTADGTTTIWVQDGQVEVTPRLGGGAALVNGGEIVATPLTGGVTLDAPRPSPDTGIGPTPRIRIPRFKQNK
ncbi:MAG: FecR family protein [Dongiaceae bacterium]